MELYTEEIDSGSRCSSRHRIWLVAEGYGYCVEDYRGEAWPSYMADHPLLYPPEYFAWRFSPPMTDAGLESITGCQWRLGDLENGKQAWVQHGYSYAKKDVLDAILADMEAHRSLPFDEEAERARLVPV